MIVVDANVVLRGLRSRNGASHLILRGMLSGSVTFAASPAIVLEYEDVLKREGSLGMSPISTGAIDRVLDTLCLQAVPALPWFRFRPFLIDPKDDIYIECALAAGAGVIVTDDRHFGHPAVKGFGLRVRKAGEYVADMHEGKST